MHTQHLETLIPMFVWIMLGIGVFFLVILGVIALLSINREDDPVYNCGVYKTIGCAHVDGPCCDMARCEILHTYKFRQEVRDNIVEFYSDRHQDRTIRINQS